MLRVPVENAFIQGGTVVAKQRRTSRKFPLTRHPSGQWCKKIHGKLHYFGTNKQAAYERYLREAAQLHAGLDRSSIVEPTSLTVKDIANHYLAYQDQRAQAGEITAIHFEDCRRTLAEFLRIVGANLPADGLRPEDLFRTSRIAAARWPSSCGSSARTFRRTACGRRICSATAAT